MSDRGDVRILVSKRVIMDVVTLAVVMKNGGVDGKGGRGGTVRREGVIVRQHSRLHDPRHRYGILLPKGIQGLNHVRFRVTGVG